MQYSPDGRLLAVVGRGRLEVLQATDGTFVRRFEDVDAPAHARVGVFLLDGALVASGNDDGKIRVWRVSDGALVRTIAAHRFPIISLAFSSSSGGILASTDQETARLWRLSDGTLMRELPSVAIYRNVVAFSPDGTTLAGGGWDGYVRLWRVSDGMALWTKPVGRASIVSIAFSPDGSTVASGSLGAGGLRLWRASDGTLLREPGLNEDPVPAVAFSSDGSVVATSHFGPNELRLWRVSDGTSTRTPRLEAAPTSLAFSPDGEVLASADGAAPVRFWRARDTTSLRAMPSSPDSAGDVLFSPDGALMVTGGTGPDRRRIIRVWRTSDRTQLRDLDGVGSPLLLSRDGRTLVGRPPDGAGIRVWRVADWAVRDVPAIAITDGLALTPVALTPDGEILASRWWDEAAGLAKVRLWRTSDGSVVRDLSFGAGGRDAQAFSLAFSPDGATLASGVYREGSNNRASLWRVSDGALLRELSWDGGYAYAVTFSPDGAALATGDNGDKTRLWRVSDGALLWEAPGRSDIVAFSPDGRILAGGNLVTNAADPGTVRLWRAADGLLLQRLTGHGRTASSIAFSADGHTLVASGDTVRLWCRR